jgi:hypothetical protein
MPQYRPAALARSARLDAAADELYTEGTKAKSNDDRYILSTVFFASHSRCWSAVPPSWSLCR